MMKMMSISIRKATIEDIDVIVKIEESCFIDNWDFDTFYEILTSGSSFSLNKSNIHIYVATFEDIIIGYICFSINKTVGHILNFAVFRDYRNKGVGTKLLKNAINIMRENGCKRIILEVSTINENAISLYKKFGFKNKKILKNYYRMNDAYRFELIL